VGKTTIVKKKETLSKAEFINSKDQIFDFLLDMLKEREREKGKKNGKERERGPDDREEERRRGKDAKAKKKKRVRMRSPPPSSSMSEGDSPSDGDTGDEDTVPLPNTKTERKIPSVHAVIFNKMGLGPGADSGVAPSSATSGVSKRSLAYELVSALKTRATWAPVGSLGVGSLMGSFRRQADEDVRKMKQLRNVAEIENLAGIGDAWLGIIELMVNNFGLDRIPPGIWAVSQQLGELVSSRIIAVHDADAKGHWGDAAELCKMGASAFETPYSAKKALNKYRAVTTPRPKNPKPVPTDDDAISPGPAATEGPQKPGGKRK
jgi:hypothetical protein